MKAKTKLTVKKTVPKVDVVYDKNRPNPTKIKESGGMDKGFIMKWF